MNLVKIIMTTSYRWNFIPKRRTNTFQIPINGLTIHVTDHKDSSNSKNQTESIRATFFEHNGKNPRNQHFLKGGQKKNKQKFNTSY